MKCTACQLDIVENKKEHYKSDLHKLNVQRQMYHIPPISLHEFELEGTSSDISLDIGVNNVEQRKVSKKKSEKKNKLRKALEICLFCEKEETFEHYLEHDFKELEAQYLLNKTCYVCNEGFTTKPGLKEHLETDNHRTAFIIGNNLVLENGKVIFNRNRSVEGGQIVQSSNRNHQIINFTPKKEHFKDKNYEEKNKLKISMNMNSQKHFRPDWMQ